MTVNRRMLLTSRPSGRVSLDNFTVDESPVPEPGEGDALIRNLYISLDPTNRVWMVADSYLPKIEEGAVMRGLGLGQVIASSNERFPVGDLVVGPVMWQEYALTSETPGLTVLPRGTGLPMTMMLGALGMTGMTAFWGVTDILEVSEGETFVVDGAAGAVGSVAGQIAKAAGARVVGIAGTKEKCDWLTDEIGFDVAICYRDDDWKQQLADATPEGVHAQFENIGGEIMDAVFDRLRTHGRLALCGMISDYNENAPSAGPSNFAAIIAKRIRLQGFLILDYGGRTMEAMGKMIPLLQQGKLKHEETLVDGDVTMAPEALNMLFDGENRGKLILKIAEPDLEVPAP